MGTFTALTGNSSLGVMSIAVLFVIGFVMMLKVPARGGGGGVGPKTERISRRFPSFPASCASYVKQSPCVY